MNKLFRQKDVEKIKLLHPSLQVIIYKAAELGGRFIIIWTVRGKRLQNKAFRDGYSNARFGQSAHNYKPALGFDFGPAKYPGHDRDYAILAGTFKRAADMLHIPIVWGGTWKRKDLGHIELASWKAMPKTLAE